MGFDVAARATYRSISHWQRDVESSCGCIPTVLAGNKADVAEGHRQVTLQTVRSGHLYKSRQVQYYDLSVQSSHNFEKPFLWLARRLANQPQLEFVGQFANT